MAPGRGAPTATEEALPPRKGLEALTAAGMHPVVAAVAPGWAGVNEAFNVASLHEATSAATASAYFVGHQLLSTVWNVALTAVLVAVALGRSGGKRLVEESPARARELRPNGADAVLRGGASS